MFDFHQLLHLAKIIAALSNPVREMFGAIASRYDLANSVLSLGMHHSWRRRLVRLAALKPGAKVLDCACGTGDLTFAFANSLGPDATVIGTDFTPEMVELATAKAKTQIKHGETEVEFSMADVMGLPFDAGSFDATCIAFGIRNVDDPQRGIAELARVVRPGGKVIVLEFGQPTAWLFGSLYRFYSHHIIPTVGGLVTGNPEAYRYLNRTSLEFPSGHSFAELMLNTGSFSNVTLHSFSLGIAYAYIGVVQE